MKNLFITVIGLILIIAGFYYIEEIVPACITSFIGGYLISLGIQHK